MGLKIGLFFTCIAGLLTVSYGSELNRDALKFKFNKFHRMRSTGITMTSLGVTHLILGAVLISTAKDRKEEISGTGSSVTHYDPKRPLGVISATVGFPLTVVGIILIGVGNDRVLRYQRLLNSTSLRLDIGPGQNDVAFYFSF
jgi:hypothetical protein